MRRLQVNLHAPTDLPDGKLISAAASVSAERSPPESSAPHRGRRCKGGIQFNEPYTKNLIYFLFYLDNNGSI